MDLSGNDIGVLGLKYLSILFGENFTINDLVSIILIRYFVVVVVVVDFIWSKNLLCITQNIARNYIGSGGIEHLNDIFHKNNMLRKLDISGNLLFF